MAMSLKAGFCIWISELTQRCIISPVGREVPTDRATEEVYMCCLFLKEHGISGLLICQFQNHFSKIIKFPTFHQTITHIQILEEHSCKNYGSVLSSFTVAQSLGETIIPSQMGAFQSLLVCVIPFLDNSFRNEMSRIMNAIL